MRATGMVRVTGALMAGSVTSPRQMRPPAVDACSGAVARRNNRVNALCRRIYMQSELCLYIPAGGLSMQNLREIWRSLQYSGECACPPLGCIAMHGVGARTRFGVINHE